MLITSKNPPLLPPKGTASKLFIAGSTIGPIVDSLHNQCLLTYDFAPITLQDLHLFQRSTSDAPLFSSSWAVPPLLGFAYIVLGYILPRIIEFLFRNVKINQTSVGAAAISSATKEGHATDSLQTRAILAVTSTAAIIKLSEFLETHSGMTYQIGDYTILLNAKTNLLIMMFADALQWISLDRTFVALLTAIITGVGGPLSELPFVANGFWHYISGSADYLPLSGAIFQSGSLMDGIASSILGVGYEQLALSSITGPCYFAVTLDAIALGRLFYQNSIED